MRECKYAVVCPFILLADLIFQDFFYYLSGCTGIFTYGAQDLLSLLQHAGSLVVAYGIQFTDQAELGPTTLSLDSHWTTREVLFLTCIFIYFVIYFIPIDFNMKFILFTYISIKQILVRKLLCAMQL